MKENNWVGYLPFMPVNARDSAGQAGKNQGQARDKQGQTWTFPFCPCCSLLVPVRPCLSLLVLVCPCLSLSVPVRPCMSLHLPYFHVYPCR